MASLIRKGYKGKALKIISATLYHIKKKIKLNFSKLVWLIFFKLLTRLELRKKQTGKNSILIPFIIKKSRQTYIATKWIILALNKNKNKILLVNKLIEEFLGLYTTNSNCKILNYKNENFQQVLKNRGNIHFRW